jgi:hypothetical protein
MRKLVLTVICQDDEADDMADTLEDWVEGYDGLLFAEVAEEQPTDEESTEAEQFYTLGSMEP